jgi:hypothetical protein
VHPNLLVRAIVRSSLGHEPRFAWLPDRFLARQDDQGRRLCGSVSRNWPLEKRNRHSKWVTLCFDSL